MYYITIGELIDALQELPKDLEVNSIGNGYSGSRHYLAISDLHGNALKEVNLNRRDNDAC